MSCCLFFPASNMQSVPCWGGFDNHFQTANIQLIQHTQTVTSYVCAKMLYFKIFCLSMGMQKKGKVKLSPCLTN
jgi:hypothetical protein